MRRRWRIDAWLWTVIGLGCILVAALVPAVVAQAQSRADGQGSFDDRYQLIVQRNIFSRDRSPVVRRPPPRDPPPRPEQMMTLTGTALPAGAEPATAFVEDARDGSTHLFHAGDTLAVGRVQRIGFDFIEYESSGQTKRIAVGLNLEGTSPSARAGGGGPTTAPTPASIDGAAAPSGSDDDIVAKLKQRRQQELKK